MPGPGVGISGSRVPLVGLYPAIPRARNMPGPARPAGRDSDGGGSARHTPGGAPECGAGGCADPEGAPGGRGPVAGAGHRTRHCAVPRCRRPPLASAATSSGGWHPGAGRESVAAMARGHPPVVVCRDDRWEFARTDNVWVFGEARDQAETMLAACHAAPAPFDRFQVEQMLTCAALEGLTFTAQAVVQVLGLPADDLVEFWDTF